MDASKVYRFEEANATVEVAQRENLTTRIDITGDMIQKVLVANRDVESREVVILDGEEFEIQIRGKGIFAPLVEALTKEGLLDTAINNAIADRIQSGKLKYVEG